MNALATTAGTEARRSLLRNEITEARAAAKRLRGNAEWYRTQAIIADGLADIALAEVEQYAAQLIELGDAS